MSLISLFKARKNKKIIKSSSQVLIGTVKSSEQFDICIREKFYHIPLSALIPEYFSKRYELSCIKYVSIYQSKNLYKNDCGIKYLGLVESFSIVKRYEITQIPKTSSQLYVLFKISQWQKLEEPIKASEFSIYPALIVPFGTFKASKDTFELSLDTAEKRELYRALKELSTNVNMKSFQFGYCTFYDENDTLVVFKDGTNVLQLPMEVIRELPQSGFEAVMLSIEGEI